MNVGEKLKSHQQLSNNAASQVDYKATKTFQFKNGKRCQTLDWEEISISSPNKTTNIRK